jgi:hypothetical protein
MVMSYGRFVTSYRSRLQVDGTNMLSRNVVNKLPFYPRKIPPKSADVKIKFLWTVISDNFSEVTQAKKLCMVQPHFISSWNISSYLDGPKNNYENFQPRHSCFMNFLTFMKWRKMSNRYPVWRWCKKFTEQNLSQVAKAYESREEAPRVLSTQKVQ